MTPEEVFSQLRDIHIPEVGTAQGPAWAKLDPRPLVVFVVFALGMAIMPAWRKWQRRQSLKIEIARLALLPPPDQRDALARLATRLPGLELHGPGHGVPSAFFQPPSKIGALEAEILRRWLLERIG